jgi:hypothetical protein
VRGHARIQLASTRRQRAVAFRDCVILQSCHFVPILTFVEGSVGAQVLVILTPEGIASRQENRGGNESQALLLSGIIETS